MKPLWTSLVTSGTRRQASRWHVALVLLLALVYVLVLLRNVNESERRSLRLHEDAKDGDHVRAIIRIVDVNTNTAEMTARIHFRLSGAIAMDQVTPAADLRLLLNSVKEPQEVEFRKGRRMNPILAVFSLEGNVNRYPLDRHAAYIWLLVLTPGRAGRSVAPPERDDRDRRESAATAADLVVGAAALARSDALPIALDLSASIPGLKFQGRVAEAQRGVEGVELLVGRADNVIVVSILVMLLMMGLAVSILLMALRATTSAERDLLPLSLSISLIFGLPALRNVQPGVPPLGAFADYVSFIWAEHIVAAAAVIIMWTWLMRFRRPKAAEVS